MADKIEVTFVFGEQTVHIEASRDKAFTAMDFLMGRVNNITKQKPKTDLNLKREEITDFIKSQPQYEFSIDDIAKTVISDDELSNIDREELTRLLNIIRTMTNRIRKSIADSENGEWGSYRKGRRKVYYFKHKTDEIEPKIEENESTQHDINNNQEYSRW